MSKIIKKKERIVQKIYEVLYPYKDCPEAGFCFTADKDFNVLTAQMHPEGLANYRKCLDGSHPVGAPQHITRENSYTEPAILECDCGRHLALGGFTNTCKCGRDYNFAGQKLAPREFWGEETGETAADILLVH